MRTNSFSLHRGVLAASLLALITAAGCGNEAPKSAFPQQTARKYEQAVTLEGSVSDNKGPIKTGNVKVSDEKGAVIAETALQDSEHYRVQVPAGTALPILLTFYPVAGGEQLVTAVIHPTVTKYDITPLSTAIAKKARALGGYTHGNLLVAAESMGTVPEANKTTAGFRGDPTTQYGGWH
ncbi:hypothetical protein [Candidatus Methylomicrobium oryzae]|jgi:hypothetical protein|uniref:hypothetical protein n=1 Tax=Candidatus Methylomicrobium oryzae TaxID=2802053 RepID=UPI001924B260|nr:hypothetical protein [Methylomicrobium sp. RS1]MBL1263331.1 hypothetical protein [Methylomicrobium sp. RS1]